MKIDKLNYIFSSTFLIWCLSYIAAVWFDRFWIHRNIELYGFCAFIIVTVLFNILAYKFNRCCLYLIGALGFLTFSVVHVCIISVIISAIIRHERYNTFVPAMIFGFPLGLFGLFSTLYCFQQKFKGQIYENYGVINAQPKCTQLMLKFCIHDFTKCSVLLNVSIIFFFVLLACNYCYQQQTYSLIELFLLPTVFPLCILLAICFKSRKLCIPGFIGYGILITIATGFLIYGASEAFNNNISKMDLLALVVIFWSAFNYSFIGINTTLHLYQKYGPQNEAETKNAPNVFYKTSFYLWHSSKSFF